MTITVNLKGTMANIVLANGIDYAIQEEFKTACQQALSMKDVTEIQVDFTNASFLDSAGIRALFLLQKEANASGKSVILFNCNDNIRNIFEIGGFDSRFTFR